MKRIFIMSSITLLSSLSFTMTMQRPISQKDLINKKISDFPHASSPKVKSINSMSAKEITQALLLLPANDPSFETLRSRYIQMTKKQPPMSASESTRIVIDDLTFEILRLSLCNLEMMTQPQRYIYSIHAAASNFDLLFSMNN